MEDDNPSKNDKSDNDDNLLLPSILENNDILQLKEINKTEGELWGNIINSKSQPITLELRSKKKNTYIALAHHYLRFNGHAASIQFIKNALQEEDDKNLRLQLARLQAEVGDKDFILYYEQALLSELYQLRLSLEYCYYLERINYHSAALNILARQVEKRSRSSTFPDDEAVLLSHFFEALRFINIEHQQIIIEDYKQLIISSFPKEISEIVAPKSEESGILKSHEAYSIIGPELEEFESEYGLTDEFRRLKGYIYFAVSHYPAQVSIAFGASVLIFMSLLRVGVKTIQITGDIFCSILFSLLIFEFLRSFRLSQALRRRAWMKVCNNLIFSSLASLVLSYLAPKFLGLFDSYISSFTIKVISLTLVAAIMFRVVLSANTIGEAILDFKDEIITQLTKHYLRRQVANLVLGTSKWGLLLTSSNSLYLLSHATISLSAYAAVHSFFLISTWRWSFLEFGRSKQKLRDQIVFISCAFFAALLSLHYFISGDMLSVLVTSSLDACIMLGIIACYALQFPKISKTYIYIFSIIFAIFNFAPVVDWMSFFDRLSIVYGQFKNDLFVVTASIQLLVLLFLVILAEARKQPPITQTNYHGDVMNSKYDVNATNIGFVGEHNVTGDINQQAQGNINQQALYSDAPVDIKSLASELADLRIKFASEVKLPEHYEVMSKILIAENAAKEGDKNKCLETLKNIGSWFWDTSNKIGVGVATAAAKSYLGV